MIEPWVECWDAASLCNRKPKPVVRAAFCRTFNVFGCYETQTATHQYVAGLARDSAGSLRVKCDTIPRSSGHSTVAGVNPLDQAKMQQGAAALVSRLPALLNSLKDIRVELSLNHEMHVPELPADPITEAAAKADGIVRVAPILRPIAGHVPTILPDEDQELRWLNWQRKRSHMGPAIKAAAAAIQQPLLISTDPMTQPEVYESVARPVNWTVLGPGQFSPLDVHFQCLLMRAICAKNNLRPWVIGANVCPEAYPACPPDHMRIAALLALLGGSSGFTSWIAGRTVGTDGDWLEDGEENVRSVEQSVNELMPFWPLVRQFRQVQPMIGVLWSLEDRCFTKHWEQADCQYATVRNCVKALSGCGSNIRLVFDSERFDSDMHIRALVVPQLDFASRSLFDKLQAFVNRGGELIACPGSVAATVKDAEVLTEPDHYQTRMPWYKAHVANLKFGWAYAAYDLGCTAFQNRSIMHQLRGELSSVLSTDDQYPMVAQQWVGGGVYWSLVNVGLREGQGPRNARWNAFTSGRRVMEDEAEASPWTNSTRHKLEDVRTGAIVKQDEVLTIEPAGWRLYKVI